MSGQLTFVPLSGGGSAVNELVGFLTRYSGRPEFGEWEKLYLQMKRDAEHIEAHLERADEWRPFHGCNGGVFPVMIKQVDSKKEPFAVYTAIVRDPPRHSELLAIYFGERPGRNFSTIVESLWNEVSKRLTDLKL